MCDTGKYHKLKILEGIWMEELSKIFYNSQINSTPYGFSEPGLLLEAM